LFVAANEQLSRDVPDGWHQVPGSMSLTISGPPERGNANQMGLALKAGHKLYQAVDSAPLRNRLRGMAADEAVPWLQTTLRLEEPPYVRISPSWFPWMPWVDARISLKFAWEAG